MKRQWYPTDLRDREWSRIRSHFEISYPQAGRPLKYSRREILNAIFYILRTGCQWRNLPHDFPSWKAVYQQFRRWKKQKKFERLNERLTRYTRLKLGRRASPSACIIDSQSKTAAQRLKSKYKKVRHMWADRGYQSKALHQQLKQKHSIDLEIVRKPRRWFWVPKDTPIEALPKVELKMQAKRWIVERTFAWINKNRRLSKEYEYHPDSTENFIYLAMSRLILRRHYAPS